jgi:hypothetical protein
MPDYDAWARSVPDGRERWEFRRSTAVAQFHARQISDDCFRALLHGLGFRGALLKAEFGYHESNRNNPV